MIEVLIGVVVFSLGLLGIAVLHMKLQAAEIEAFQRSQALSLLQDMAYRLASNRHNAASYVTTSELGSGMTCATQASNETLQQTDNREWCLNLQGASEKAGASSVGGMVGGRGCIEALTSANSYMITVVWQGMSPISAPPSTVTCGQGLYDGGTGSSCQNDQCRRYLTTVVNIGALR